MFLAKAQKGKKKGKPQRPQSYARSDALSVSKCRAKKWFKKEKITAKAAKLCAKRCTERVEVSRKKSFKKNFAKLCALHSVTLRQAQCIALRLNQVFV